MKGSYQFLLIFTLLVSVVRVTLGGHVHDVESELRVQSADSLEADAESMSLTPVKVKKPPVKKVREVKVLTFMVSGRYELTNYKITRLTINSSFRRKNNINKIACYAS